METYLVYIGKAAIAAGAFYIAFLLLFQNQKHFTFNRIYLPVSLALSFVIPLITFTTVKYIEPVTIPDSGSFAYLPAPAEIPQQPDFIFEWYHYLFGLYLLGTAGFLFHLLLGHLKAINIIQKSRIQKIFDNQVNITPKDVHPFSFFSKIVVSEKTLSHPDLEMIVSHENIHVREKHTLDILFTEIMFLLQWFNPFAWLLKDAVKNNLEYLTDHEIAKHYNPQTYQLAMVTLADKQGIAPFLTALNGSQLKNRIVMMKKKTENKYAFVKQLVVLPLLAILVMGLSNKEVKTEIISQQSSANQYKGLIVIVDGQNIPTNSGKLSSLDLSKNYDSGEIIETLEIDKNKVESTVMSFDDNSKEARLFIRTTDYVEGNNREFDEMTKKQVQENQPAKPSKTFYAIDGNLKTKEEIGNLENYSIESMSVLTGKNATEKYGEEVTDASVIDLKTGESRVKIITSEEKTIQGKVTNEKGEPLIGASVFIKGKTIGTITDAKGNYEIKSEEGIETLIFAMNGYEKQEIKVGDEEEISIKLIVDKNAKHKEIVVVGYGTAKTESTSEGGYSISGGMNGTMQKGSENVTITSSTPNGITIRGTSGLNGQPLYVVDGVEVKSIEKLSPEGIEKIEILKDQSSTILYGEKGKNGVLLITTKKGISSAKSDDVVVTGYATNSLNQGNVVTLKSTDGNTSHPLVIVDGQEFKSMEEANVPPEDIASISVLKGETASPKIYGEKAKDGVIVINTKTKYNSGSVEVSAKNKMTTKQGEPVFFIVEEMPEFPGGDVALRTKIAHDIKYPVIAQENGIQGKVYVSFIISEKGKVTEPFVSNGVDPALDKEALRVVSSLPDWKPGKQHGQPVNVSYTIPITFALQNPIEKQTIFDLRSAIARNIKYPVVAQENNQQGVVEIWAFIAKDGTISRITDKKPDGKFINVDEVVVTSLKSEKTVTSEKSKDLDLLIKESKRVIGQLSPLKIPELAGETVSFRIRFVLE